MPAAARAPEVAAALKLPFAEQIAFFRGKLGRLVPTAKWTDLWQQEHDVAFMVAGAAKADLLADLAEAVDKAIADGETIQQFRRRFLEIIQRRGWAGFTGDDRTADKPGGGKGLAWRTRVIYETNLLTSYAAGRRAQLEDGGYTHWMYKHSDFVQRPRPHHVALNGIVRPKDDPFWQTHYPPNGWGCRCRVLGVRGPAQARRLGGDWDKPLPSWAGQTDPKTGAPVGVDKGFGYMPGGSVVERVRALTPQYADTPPKGAPLLPPICDGGMAAMSARDCPGPLPRPRPLDERLLLPSGRRDEYYIDAFLEVFGARRGKPVVFTDVTGERLLIDESLFIDRAATIAAGRNIYKAIKRGRGPWMRVLAETLRYPQEVWEQWEWIAAREWQGARAAMTLRRRYLSWWESPDHAQPGLSVFEWVPKRWWVGVTTFTPDADDASYLEGVRSGRRRFPK